MARIVFLPHDEICPEGAVVEVKARRERLPSGRAQWHRN